MTGEEIAEACQATTARGTRPTLPEVRPLTRAYCELPGNAAGGSLHIVLEDGNLERSDVEYCRGYAAGRGDTVGALLADVLLMLSSTQRRGL